MFEHIRLVSLSASLLATLMWAAPVWAQTDAPVADPPAAQAPQSAEQAPPAAEPAPAESAPAAAASGQADLDAAMRARITADGVDELGNVIDLLDSALEKGLPESRATFARQLLVSALVQRAHAEADSMQPTDPRRDPSWLRARERALGDLARATSLNAEQWEAYLLIARLQSMRMGNVMLGDPVEARGALDKIIQGEGAPDSMKAQAHVLHFAITDGMDEKLADLNAAVRLQPENTNYLLLRAQFHSSQERFTEAEADARRLIELDAENAAVHDLLGLVLLGQEKFDEALESFNRSSELAPNALLPYQHRAELFRQQDQMAKAVEQLSKLIELSQDDWRTYLLRATVYAQMEEYAKAIADLDEVIRIQPALVEPYNMRARLYFANKQTDKAIEGLENILAIAPNQHDLRSQLGMYYLVEKQVQKAWDAFNTVLEADAANTEALIGRGDANLSLGKHAEAIRDFDEAYKVDRENSHLLNNFAWVLATSPFEAHRNGKRAIELATQACELTEFEAPHILSTLAAAYAETGDFEKAIEWSQKAVELGVEDESKEQLAQELASYKEGKPWRELQEVETEAAEESPATEENFAPPSAEPARARTADF